LLKYIFLNRDYTEGSQFGKVEIALLARANAIWVGPDGGVVVTPGHTESRCH
jgi:hypothetical protein